jgi:hypothetical protein
MGMATLPWDDSALMLRQAQHEVNFAATWVEPSAALSFVLMLSLSKHEDAAPAMRLGQ